MSAVATAEDAVAVVTHYLERLKADVPNVRDVLVSTLDGFTLASTAPSSNLDGGNADLSSASAMVSAALALGQQIVSVVGATELSETTYRTDQGYVVLYSIFDFAVLTVFATSNVTLAYLHRAARACVEQLEGMIVT